MVSVRAGYDAWAATYDHDANATRDLDATVLRATDLPLDGAMVVELGAGTGKNTAYLATRAARVVALDLSAAMLAAAAARGLGGHVAFIAHDITTPWPVADAAADLVTANLVLEHVADLVPVFAEAARVLRPEGLMAVSELHPYRQLRGAGARFADGDGDVRIDAHVHSVAAYVGGGLAAGLVLRSVAEPGDGGVPRLLQLVFAKPRVDPPVF